MRIIKKVLAMALTAAFALNGAVIARASGEADDKYAEDIDLLNRLSITNIDTEDFNADAKVKRTVFADAIASMMIDDLDEYSGNARGDLTNSDKGMIYLADRGIIGGYGDDSYLPANEITTFEALTIMLSAMGYSSTAQILGGYPNGYVSAANQAGLLDGITFNADGTFAYKHFVKLLINCIEANIMVVDSVGTTAAGGTYPIYKESDETMLSEYREIYKSEGIVTANDITGLYSARENTGKGKVIIDSVIYEDPTRTASDLLGSKVEFYYDENEGEATKVLWASADKTSTMTIKAKDIESFEDNKYTYVTDTRTKNEKIPETIKVFYNGVYSTRGNHFVPESGDVTLIDTDDDDTWDIIKIREPKYVVVQSVYEEETIYDKFSPDYNLTLDGVVYDNYVIRDSQNTELDIASITADSLLEVEAADNGYCGITVVDNVIEATLKSIQNDEDGSYESIDTDLGTYDVTARFNELIGNGDIKNFDINEIYKFYLNSENEVILAESLTEGKYRVGYIRKMYKDETTLDDTVYVNMLDSSGVNEKFILADSVTLGKDKYKVATVANNFTLSNYNDKACLYTLNVNGEITELYLASDNTNKIKEVYKHSDAYMYNFVSGYAFGTYTANMEREPVCSLPSTATIFFVPSNPSGKSDEYFNVVTADDIRRYIKYNITMYNINDEIGWGDFAVIKSDIPFMKAQSVRPILVEDVEKYYDETDEETYMKITGYQFENGITITIKDDREIQGECPFASGDIAFCMLGNDGKLRLSDVEGEKSYDILLDYNKGKEPTIASSYGKVNTFAPTYYRNVYGSARFVYGAVYKAENNMIWVNPSDNLKSTNLIEAFNCSTAKAYVYKYDEQLKKFKKIPVNQAVGYENDPVDYDRAFVYTTDASYALVVLY